MSDKSELLQLFLRNDCFISDKFPALSKAVRFYKKTEKGRETMCEAVESYAKQYAEQYAEHERAEGRIEGRAEGEQKFSTLVGRLLASKRYNDLEKVTNDLEYRRILYIEFSIEQ